MFLAYFIQNLTVFDTPAPLIVFYFGLGLVYFITSTPSPNHESNTNIQREEKLKFKKFPLPILIMLVIIFLPMALYYFNIKPLIASAEAIKGVSLLAKSPSQGLEFYKKSLGKNTFINPEVRLNMVKNLAEKGIINSGALKEEDIKFVISEMEKNIVEHPNDARYWLDLGQLYDVLSQKHKEYLLKAEKVLEQAEKLSPNRQQIYYALANTKIAEGDTESAIELAKKAVDLDPQVGEPHKILGLIYLQAQQLEKGLAEIEQAEKNFDVYQNSNLTLYVAAAYLKTGNLARAISLTELAKNRDPNNFQVYMQLSVLYKEAGEKEKAIEAARKAVELNPNLSSQAEEFIKSLK
jgi:tetratricopeptide (TPR) repeat protein